MNAISPSTWTKEFYQFSFEGYSLRLLIRLFWRENWIFLQAQLFIQVWHVNNYEFLINNCCGSLQSFVMTCCSSWFSFWHIWVGENRVYFFIYTGHWILSAIVSMVFSKAVNWASQLISIRHLARLNSIRNLTFNCSSSNSIRIRILQVEFKQGNVLFDSTWS